MDVQGLIALGFGHNHDDTNLDKDSWRARFPGEEEQPRNKTRQPVIIIADSVLFVSWVKCFVYI